MSSVPGPGFTMTLRVLQDFLGVNFTSFTGDTGDELQPTGEDLQATSAFISGLAMNILKNHDTIFKEIKMGGTFLKLANQGVPPPLYILYTGTLQSEEVLGYEEFDRCSHFTQQLILSKLSMTHRLRESTLNNRMSGDFAHIAGAKFPDLSSNTIFFDQRFLKKFCLICAAICLTKTEKRFPLKFW
uniref:Uncharacterized protein n=1 Tax=Romanomermis culicivorax TaxID=13658 RepID=A0A915KNZ9_ROMCU